MNDAHEENDTVMASGEQSDEETDAHLKVARELSMAHQIAAAIGNKQTLEQYDVDGATAAAVAELIEKESSDDEDKSMRSTETGSPATVGKRKSTGPDLYHLQLSSTENSQGVAKSCKLNKVAHGENPLLKKNSMLWQHQSKNVSQTQRTPLETQSKPHTIEHSKQMRGGSSAPRPSILLDHRSKRKDLRRRDRQKVEEFRKHRGSMEKQSTEKKSLECDYDPYRPGGMYNPWE